MEVGRGGDRRLGAHGLVQLVGQRLHFGQRRRVDVLEHEVHAGQRRRPEEVGHQLRAPLIAPAADDRHLGRHAATVQSRSWFASGVAPPWRWPPLFAGSGMVHLVRPQAFASIMPRAIPEEHHTNLIYASGVVELVCAAGLVRRTRWASRRQPRHPGGGVPGQHPDGARRRDGPQRRPVGQPRRRLGPPAAAAGDGLGRAPGAPRTATDGWRSGCSAPVTTASSRRPPICSTARPGPTRRLASSPRHGHHLLIAYEDEQAVGFVSGVEVTHPDKGTEMFLYELAVDEPFRRRGIGRALVERLAALAREAGCYGMWVHHRRRQRRRPRHLRRDGRGTRGRAGRGGLDLLNSTRRRSRPGPRPSSRATVRVSSQAGLDGSSSATTVPVRHRRTAEARIRAANLGITSRRHAPPMHLTRATAHAPAASLLAPEAGEGIVVVRRRPPRSPRAR